MSILVNAAYERVLVNCEAGLTNNRTQAWSISGWGKLTGTNSSTGHNQLLGIYTHTWSNPGFDMLGANGAFAGDLRCYNSFWYTSLSNDLPTDGNWHYYALCNDGAGTSTSLKAYVWDSSGTLYSSASRTSETVNVFTPIYFSFGAAPNYGDLVYAYWAYGRAWAGAALSQSEFETELASATVVKTSNIYSAFGADSVTDVSGNSRNWSAEGGATVETGTNPTIFTKKLKFFALGSAASTSSIKAAVARTLLARPSTVRWLARALSLALRVVRPY